MKRILFPVIKGGKSAGNVAISKKEDDELRKSDYWKWSLKHLDARREKEKEEQEDQEEDDGDGGLNEEDEKDDDEEDGEDEEDEEDEEEDWESETYLAAVRMKQIRETGETDRLGRRHDLDGDLIPEPELDFWTTVEGKDVLPQTEEEKGSRVDRSQRTRRDRKDKERRDRKAEKVWVNEYLELNIDERRELDTEDGDARQEEVNVEVEDDENEPGAGDCDMRLRRSQ